mgnify:CR=1 FL=1
MKNILRKILIIFILLISSISVLSLADNEVDNSESVNYNDEVMPISDDADDTSNVDASEDTTEENETDYNTQDSTEDENDYTTKDSTSKNYFYAGTEDVNITTPVEGDVFVVTSGNVIIDTDICGNAFICANTVTIGEYSIIEASLFNASNSLILSGDVGINVYNISKNLTLSGTVDYDVFSSSAQSNLSGYISRNANISSENITISDELSIEGDLNYSSKKQVDIPENTVEGKVNFSSINTDTEVSTITKMNDFLTSVLSLAVLAIVLFVIGKWLNCKFISTYPDLVKNLPKSLLYGFLTLIVVPVISLILLICGVTINLAFILTALYLVLLLIASSIVIVILSKLVAEKLNVKFEKANNTLLTILSIIVLSIVYKLIQLIPVLGSITIFAFLIIGIGILINNIIPNKEVKNS